MSKMKVYQEKVETQPMRVDTVLTPERPEVEQVKEIAQEAGSGSIGWAQGMAEKGPEGSIGWAQGMAEEGPEGSVGWAQGMAEEAPKGSPHGWAKGY